MADLIDRAALLDAFREYMVEHCDRERCASEENCKTCDRGCLWRKVVMEAPAVDAVEVVRCGECKKNPQFQKTSGKHMVWCRRWRTEVKDTGFCSDGERRADT